MFLGANFITSKFAPSEKPAATILALGYRIFTFKEMIKEIIQSNTDAFKINVELN